MATLAASPSFPAVVPRESNRSFIKHLCLLLLLWSAIYAFALATPPLLDDADATHAQAAQAMLRTGDWVTLHVDGIRYLEKAPLPYWIAAISLRLFGENAFAIHLPLALAVLGLAALGYRWALRSFDRLTAFYTALFLLTSAGVFLFTRIFIPEALLSLLLGCGLYAFHRALEPASVQAPRISPKSCHPERSEGPAFYTSSQDILSPFDPFTAESHPAVSGLAQTPVLFAMLFWLCMALAVLTKGLIAVVFLMGTAALYFTVTRTWHHWRALQPVAGALLFLAVAAPWHILAGFRNTQGADGHGFFWFYFINEHVLRFLGRRTPRDYNKLPTLLYWLLHFVWLFPWSFFAPAAALQLWRKRHRLFAVDTPAQRTFVLLACFSTLVLVFFSLSTNQEYYTFPVYLPLLMLLAAALRRAQRTHSADGRTARALQLSYAALAVAGILAAAALAYGLWQSRRLPFVPDIGTLLERRGVGSYTLSLSHFFDLTGASFAALRLPSAIALCALGLGPCLAWLLSASRRGLQAVLVLAASSAVFLIAAHIAFCRFAPMLSSAGFAQRILQLEREGRVAPPSRILLYGDQAFGSSIPFYLHRPVQLVDGRSSSMLFGSTFPDVSAVFVSSHDLAASWGIGPRKLLFIPAEQREAANRLLGPTPTVLFASSGKELVTDRPLDNPSSSPPVISTAAQRSGETPALARADSPLARNAPAR